MNAITTSCTTLFASTTGESITRRVNGNYFVRVAYHFRHALMSETHAQLQGAWCAITMCDRTIAIKRLRNARAAAALAGMTIDVKAIGDAIELLDQVKITEATKEVERIHAALELRMRIQ